MKNKENEKWSIRMTETLMKRHPYLSSAEKWGVYDCGVIGKGIERLYGHTKDERYFEYIKRYIDQYVDANGDIPKYNPEVYNIDHINNGKLVLFLYKKTGDERYKKAAYKLRGQLKNHPRTTEGGFWHKKIYPHQMWLDGVYMGSPFYVEYGKIFDEPENFDDVAKQVILANKHMRDMRTGLLYHGWDESREQDWCNPITGCSLNFWGRAMGWYAMALVDILEYLPEDHEQREYILVILDSLFKAVASVQDQETGLWYQVLDQGKREGNYLEASASAMFVYAMARAVNQGYVKDQYMESARKGYTGMLERFIDMDEDGLVDLKYACEVAGLGGDGNRSGTFEYYINEPIKTNDFKAVGAFILATVEIEYSNK